MGSWPCTQQGGEPESLPSPLTHMCCEFQQAPGCAMNQSKVAVAHDNLAYLTEGHTDSVWRDVSSLQALRVSCIYRPEDASVTPNKNRKKLST